MKNERNKTENPDANPDPITGAPGAHPVGTGVGAAGAGAAGAAIGSIAGPIGTAAGAVIGAVAGGLVGKGVAEAVNPTDEESYWRDNYKTRPYVEPSATYEDYAPAYRYGWEARDRYRGQAFEELQSDLARDWDRARGQCNLSWDKASPAARDAWERVDRRGERSGGKGNPDR